MAWQPQSGPLNQLAQCLRDTLSGHDIEAQKNAEVVCILSFPAHFSRIC